MKCQYCGNNLNIEDKFCPYCGRSNPFAVKHQEEMERYEKDYQKTKKEVLEQSSRFNRRTVKITVIAVLVALIAISCFLLAKSYDIRWWNMERSIASEAETHRQAVQQLMEARDYQALCSYVSENRITYTDDLKEYEAVFNTTQQYRRFYDYLMILQSKKADEEKFKYYSESELLEGVAKSINSLYEYMEPQKFNPEAYQGDKMEYMEDLREHTEIMVSGYFGISPEEAAGMRSMTVSRINVLLEDCYEKEQQ